MGALVVVALLLLAWPLFPDESPTGSLAEPGPRAPTPGGGSSAGRAVDGKGGQRVRASSPGPGTPVERGATVRLVLRGSGKGKGNGGNGDGDG